MYIGMTEAGDAGWDLSWFEKIRDRNACVGGILITKAPANKGFQDKAMELKDIKPIICHLGITGWGHTKMETGNLTVEETMQSVREWIDGGFPAKNLVLRIDPIFPTETGVKVALRVLKLRNQYLPDVERVRISIYDDYHTAREEICKRGYDPIDNVTKWKNELERRPTKEQIDLVAKNLMAIAPDQEFELCAEPELAEAYPEHFKWFGCLSQKDCDIMDITVPEGTGINGQQRFGCRCLQLKKELLDKKRRCPNNCAYCYWGRN